VCNKQLWRMWLLCLISLLSMQLLLVTAGSVRAAGIQAPSKKETCKTATCHPRMGTDKFVHGPVATGDCVFCHKPTQKHAFTKITSTEKLCAECHERPVTQKFAHAPFRQGKCFTCHDSHQSPYQYQLRATVAETCYKCHDRSKLKGRAHVSAAPGSCITCHASHQSDYPKLLVKPGITL